MATPTGRTAYKKIDGILTLNTDQTTVTWTPNSAAQGPPEVSVAVSNISKFQQTPDNKPKVMLKIFEKPPPGIEEAESHVFHFNTPEGRSEANAIKDLLSRLIYDQKSNDPTVPRPAAAQTNVDATAAAAAAAAPGSGSAAMAFASAAVVAKPQPASARWFDDNQLKTDIELQQSLMKKDLTIHQTYMHARETKPSSISDAAFNTQFWSTRTGLLRAHAIEINQKKGAYNVLSVVKPKVVDDVPKITMSVDQVQMILNQHPLVRRLYNENVPKLSEGDFWVRFFLSKLSKKLRGEKVDEHAHSDPLFDKHDETENFRGVQSKITADSIPHIIDVEANEENQGGFRSGNRPDAEMRPRANFPIIRTLNSVSEKLMANVAAADTTLPDATVTALRDLHDEAREDRIILSVKEQTRFFSKRDAAPSANAAAFATQVPAQVMSNMHAELDTLHRFGAGAGGGGLDLHTGIGVVDDSDSDDGGAAPPKPAHVGSRASLRAAERDIMAGVQRGRAEKYGAASESAATSLPPELAEQCRLTHATTIEFLHQFWAAFVSGNPDRAPELQYLVESLARSTERIHAAAETAERAREAAIAARKKEIRDYYERTGKKIRWKPDLVKGGRVAVMAVMQPTLAALERAQEEYRRALAAEMAQTQVEVG